MTRNSIISLGLAGIALVGCGNKTIVFHSPDGKSMVACSGEDYRKCRDASLKAGYIEGPTPVSQVPATTPRFIIRE